MTTTTGFDQDVYEGNRAGAQRSAERMVPFVVTLLGGECSSVIDVGCGEGWWAHTFRLFGASNAVGVDFRQPDMTAPRLTRFHEADLNDPVAALAPFAGSFDLAICLEAAEHLRPDAAHALVKALVDCAPRVLFSAAIPGQGGVGHVNEQWPVYWSHLFAREDYVCWDGLRSHFWDDDRIEPWYRQNAMLFVRRGEVASEMADRVGATRFVLPPQSLVHPVVFEHIAATMHDLNRRLGVARLALEAARP